MTKKVAVLGGGVGGLTAAHELIERGFAVEVFEQESYFGGKAASQDHELAGTGGRAPLPGEHGFRFFPSFYRHLPDTMARIPTDDGQNVGARLLPSKQMALADKTGLYIFDRHPPKTIGELLPLFDTIKSLYSRLDVRTFDLVRFADRMWKFATSCDERRLQDFEPQTYWDFVGAENYGSALQKYIQSSKFMVAMNARVGNAVTIGKKAVQLFTDFFQNGVAHDAVLDGPTSDRWLTPWRNYLQAKGVVFHSNTEITELVPGVGKLIEVKAGARSITADYYVLAVPLDRAIDLVTPAVAAAEPALANVPKLRGSDSWMVGVQLYLRKRLTICQGHIAFPDSPWALTAVAQAQFWKGDFAASYGDGSVVDCLSVDVSDWGEIAPRLDRSARQCTKQEILDEVVAQVVDAIGSKFDPGDIVAKRLDSNIGFGAPMTNRTPLLIHPVGSWANRPPAELANLKNLVLASDYVKTNTDLATMEGANEAGRRAVNTILMREGSAAAPCMIASMGEETGPLIRNLKKLDRALMLKGEVNVYEGIRARQVPMDLEIAGPKMRNLESTATMRGMDDESIAQAEELLRQAARAVSDDGISEA